jgi:hypothetical protein
MVWSRLSLITPPFIDARPLPAAFIATVMKPVVHVPW